MNTAYQPLPFESRKTVAPYSVPALILGIVSLANMAILGWIPAIIALNYASKALQVCADSPGKYSDNSVSMARAGQKMATIGLVLGILGMIVTALYYYFVFKMAFHHQYHYYY